MLRFDYMPSDFHPLFLFLGSTQDLIDLVELLNDFSAEPREIPVRSAIPSAISKSDLTLVPAEGNEAEYGLRLPEDDGAFRWVLNVWQASQIAERIGKLTPEELKSGSDIFELGIEGEIPVKVSRGEFTEEFLTPTHYLHPDYVKPPSSF